MSAAAPLSMPSKLAHFELKRVLGEGGSGTVYEALDGERRVALKVLREDLALSSRDTQRFVEEANRMVRVDHPALVKLDSAGVLPDGRPYLAMQFLDGETLADRLKRGPLEPGEAVRVFGVLARAVGALHDAGFIHRDIKPENIVLVPGDAGPTPVLLDFGIAREIEGGPSTTTVSGGVRGTPAYMAPERFFGAPASVRSDIYELAVTLHMMLVGKLPWGGVESVSERLAPKSPAELGAQVPPDLARAILRAISTRPEVRPETAVELAEEIERTWRDRHRHSFDSITEDLAVQEGTPQPAVAGTTGAQSRIPTTPPPAPGSRARLVGVIAALPVIALALFVGTRLASSPSPATVAPAASSGAPSVRAVATEATPSGSVVADVAPPSSAASPSASSRRTKPSPGASAPKPIDSATPVQQPTVAPAASEAPKKDHDSFLEDRR